MKASDVLMELENLYKSSSKKITAHDVASDSDIYNRVCLIKGNEWECMGYSKSGITIKFSRIVPLANNKLLVKNCYLRPFQKVELK